ncbi:DUF5777 family beta-barrel protein [Marinoscillum sp. MHG1-6]|uniref:DUF5777 family beta-barrel protein n=1 Tax=Marinoscillum sp. MHG1-6 TaxID=2959627 RepID=UPI002157FC49|nr:DUF5777 family beta-barrel protein [Marinoscillum sp. MHG1-6]
MKRFFTLFAALVVLSLNLAGQDLLSELDELDSSEPVYTIATFKGTRVVNGHSIETKGEGELEFIISHRFGTINSGGYDLFGLDQAFIRIGLEYGLTDQLGVGIGRNSFNKIYDGYLKYKAIRQSDSGSPVTATTLISMGLQTYPQSKFDSTLTFGSRLNYTYQVLIARKISSDLSVQVAPTFVHTNRVDQTILNNDQFAMGFGARYKLTRSISLNAEYYARFDPHADSPYYNSFGLGIDIETGGHVFQLIFSNSQGMVERTFVTETAGNFFKGGIHFGFNITRTFQLTH